MARSPCEDASLDPLDFASVSVKTFTAGPVLQKPGSRRGSADGSRTVPGDHLDSIAPSQPAVVAFLPAGTAGTTENLGVSMTALLGIDCATDPRKTGLALGELHGSVAVILRAATGTRTADPAAIAADWLQGYPKALIALDAPLGWPHALSAALATHRAGEPVAATPDRLFGRDTDDQIKRRLGKRPLEVGANLIARTAVSALSLLERLRRLTGFEIPLAWAPQESAAFRALEVYPAATRLGHGARDRGGSLDGLSDALDVSAVHSALQQSPHAADAAVCVLAAADFLRGQACPPNDLELATREGWIWAPSAI